MQVRSCTHAMRPNLIAFSNFSFAKISAPEILGFVIPGIKVRFTYSCSCPLGSQITGIEGANSRENRFSAKSLGESTPGKLSMLRISFRPMSFKTCQNMLRFGFVSLFCDFTVFHKKLKSRL